MATRLGMTYSHLANSVCVGRVGMAKRTHRNASGVEEGHIPSLIIHWHLPHNGEKSQQTLNGRLMYQKPFCQPCCLTIGCPGWSAALQSLLWLQTTLSTKYLTSCQTLGVPTSGNLKSNLSVMWSALNRTSKFLCMFLSPIYQGVLITEQQHGLWYLQLSDVTVDSGPPDMAHIMSQGRWAICKAVHHLWESDYFPCQGVGLACSVCSVFFPTLFVWADQVSYV